VITVSVANTGKRNGTEIVQVYIKKVADPNGPVKTLRGFKRINVAAGKTAQAVVHLPYSSFEFYDEKSLQMTVTPGEYEVWYGNSSAQKDLKMIKVTIQPSNL
jgi:beta-glucosidase